MEWTQQMDEMGKQWADMQKKLWLNWNEVAKQASANVQTKAVWQQMLDAWKNAVYRVLDMQVESARLWSESIAAGERADWGKPGRRVSDDRACVRYPAEFEKRRDRGETCWLSTPRRTSRCPPV